MTKADVRAAKLAHTPRRGLSRVEAAIYIGVSATKFDELVGDGRMPRPKRIDGRKIWDIRTLDLAFDDLPSEDESRMVGLITVSLIRRLLYTSRGIEGGRRCPFVTEYRLHMRRPYPATLRSANAP